MTRRDALPTACAPPVLPAPAGWTHNRRARDWLPIRGEQSPDPVVASGAVGWQAALSDDSLCPAPPLQVPPPLPPVLRADPPAETRCHTSRRAECPRGPA